MKRTSETPRGSEQHQRPRVFYVSYDGVQEPLGQSQILPYLRRLSGEYALTLISFEKTRRGVHELRQRLVAEGITWIPLQYHRRPPVVSTAMDVLAGRRALIRAAEHGEPAIIHVRSYVPALIALLARRRTGGRLLFDIRGFWADERVEGGLWQRGFLYRTAKRCERWFFAEADAVVTLTEASVPQIKAWSGERDISVTVIPTCVDLERFVERPQRVGGPHVVWIGSISTWYRFDVSARIAAALAMPLTVVTQELELARRQLNGYPGELLSAPPEAMPDSLFAGDVGLCLVASSFSKLASAPTRFAEYLAVGMPVLVTPGVGDLERLVETHGIGAVLRGEDPESVAEAADRMRSLIGEPQIADRCRRVARKLFDANSGSERYDAIYRSLLR